VAGDVVKRVDYQIQRKPPRHAEQFQNAIHKLLERGPGPCLAKTAVEPPAIARVNPDIRVGNYAKCNLGREPEPPQASVRLGASLFLNPKKSPLYERRFRFPMLLSEWGAYGSMISRLPG
jgi:hypothetical protein